MRQTSNHILVTGAHRSGTTWVGRALSQAPRSLYVHEPFNVNFTCPYTSLRTRYWYESFTNDSHLSQKQLFENLFSRQTLKPHSLLPWESMRHPRSSARKIWASLKEQVQAHQSIILKDPIALLSTEWLAENFAVKPVVMIRHPAAFVSSLKVKQWHFDFVNFLNQPEAIETFFPEEREQIEQLQQVQGSNIVAEAAHLWRILHKVILKYRLKYPNWIFLKHEEVSSSPLRQFEQLFQKLELEFNQQIESFLLKSTHTSSRDYETHSSSEGNVIRNSSENIRVWEQRLSETEIETIRRITGETADAFYSAEEWNRVAA